MKTASPGFVFAAACCWLSFLATTTMAFVLVPSPSTSSLVSSSMAVPRSQHTTTLRLTADEILARSRQAAGGAGGPNNKPPIQDSLPLVFDEDILADMQAALLTMEQRIQEGSGSLSSEQITDLEGQLTRIVEEMHRNPHKRHVKIRVEEDSGTAGVSPSPNVVVPQPPQLPQPTLAQQAQQPEQAPPNSNEYTDVEEDGPAYDGTGGMGQPRGTVNTYIIEGMDEMSSEEYRLALQQSIIDRQRARRAAGKVGSRGSLDYLHSLSPQGTDSQKRPGLNDEDNHENGPSPPTNYQRWQK